MDALHFIKEMLSELTLREFLSDRVHENSLNLVVHKRVDDDENSLNLVVHKLTKVQLFLMTTNFRVRPEEEKLALIEGLRLTACKVGNFMSENVLCASSPGSLDLVKDWKETLDCINDIIVSCNHLNQTEEAVGALNHKVIDAVLNSLTKIKRIETMLLDTEKSSNFIPMDEENSIALLLIKAFPALGELKERSEKMDFLRELSRELGNLPELISMACKQQALALVLIGSHLSLQERAYYTWFKVKEDLCKIKGSDNHATNNHMWDIFTYCYDDLSSFLKPCFLYLACYPIGYEIPARSLTEIWIAEGFVAPEIEETMEDTANRYLEQLVQRSLIWVSKRSLLGTIKYCRVPRPIHEFAIQQSYNDGFMVANPDKEKMKSLFRLAIHHGYQNQYTEVKNNYIHALLAFDFDGDVLGDVLGNAVFLRVLELRKSVIPIASLSDMTYLRYLGLKGSKIVYLPQDIGGMKNLQTLDVRDTSIKTLPKSLWNISTLRHVYVKPSPHIKGPPSIVNTSNLQILKTVAVHESWLQCYPLYLNNLRKLALSIREDPTCKPNPYWRPISNLLRDMVNPLSLSILGDLIPTEFVDTRAFPKLETVKSFKLEGRWFSSNILMDYVDFPKNLTKLTLIKSLLKNDPMPRLEKLEGLKFLSLQDEAYIGKKIVCSSKGFPQLQFLELKKLENLENWEMNPMAMSQLTTMHVVQCPKLKNLPPNLDHVTDKIIIES